MSKASEEAFDEIQRRAKESQTIQLYFLGVLPDGTAFNVIHSMMPEALEEIGPIHSFKDPKEAMEFYNRRGEKLAALMTKFVNPMAQNLFEALLRSLAGQK